MKQGKFNGYNVFLVETQDDIEVFKSNLSKNTKVGLDTETTGLDFITDKVVGYCMSCGNTYSKDDYAGYYFPVRHKNYDNLELDVVVPLVQEVIDNYKTVLHNRNFDNFHMENDGIVIPFIGGMHDSQMMMHLVFGDNMPSLKKSAKDHLKWDMIEFTSNMEEGDFDFSNTDPTISFVYAAGDPLATVFLSNKIWKEYHYIRKIYPIDNKATEAVRRLAKAPLYLRKEIVQEELSKQLTKQQSIQQKVFALVGYHFKINSNKDKADALSRFVTLTVKTKGGALKVDGETLSRIDHPLATLLVEHAEVQKFISSYLTKMVSFPTPFRCSYSACNAATGRLSSGGQKKNSYFANFNIQNVPKTEEKVYVHLCEIHGQKITTEEEGAIGKTKSKAGIRRAFIPPPPTKEVPINWRWGSFDYISQEMVLMANFSQEPNLCVPLLEGKDIHNYIAERMFGSTDPNNRTKIKTLNFAVNYGAGEYTISLRLKIPIAEAKALLNLYEVTMKKLSAWKESMRKMARSKGMVFTYFGRPRVLFKYYSMSGNGFKAFADRSAVNSPVQGCLPLYSFLETEDSVISFESALGKRYKTEDGRYIVPSHRGNSEIIFVRFFGGDFAICDFNHQFVSGTMERPVVEKFRNGMKNPILLSKMHKKKMPWTLKVFSGPSKHLAYLKGMMVLKNEIKNDETLIKAAFWNLAITRYRFSLDTIEQSRIRSLASIYGFNVKCNFSGDQFYISFFRKKRARFHYFNAVEDEGMLQEVGSCTAMNGHQLYPTQGFVNKNTGGDIIRIALIKMYEELDRDPEFFANVIPTCTVHDEINIYFNPDYTYKMQEKMRKIMEFNPANFIVPLQVSCSIGDDWGTLGDVHNITEDNKIEYKFEPIEK